MPNEKAKATLILLPGGDAATGTIESGKPKSNNFLSRSRGHFKRAGFNVMIVYRPTDVDDLDYSYRIGKQHMGELRFAVDYARKMFGKPVWLIGTSRGTVSGTAAVIDFDSDVISGLVLTSSVTNSKPGAILSQDLGRVRVPVLVVHHTRDACKICVSSEAEKIIPLLVNSPKKEFMPIDGGFDPEGNVCQGKHWHGFINYEKETVKLITDWIAEQK